VLHPGLKLEYFRLHQWEEEWIEVAENLVREEFIDAYESHDAEPDLDDKAKVRTRTCIMIGLTVYRAARTSKTTSLTSPLLKIPRAETRLRHI
jgi:hypothetical protein